MAYINKLNTSKNSCCDRHRSHQTFFNRPDITRRNLFEVAGAGLFGSYLAGRARASEVVSTAGVTVQNTAKNLIFVQLTGAISPWDTFDFKPMVTDNLTSAQVTATLGKLNPAIVNGINWPSGILPKLGAALGDIALVRSMSAHALVHSLAQTWSQIGRNPAAALGDIAPNIGSVVAIEKDPLRTPGQIFPAFIALNQNAGVGAGYFPATYAPFRVTEGRNANATGLNNTSNTNGQTTFTTMYQRLHQYDDAYRVNSPYGSPLEDYNTFYASAKNMMYNAEVNKAFTYTTAESQAYGNSPFGNACLVAKKILAANQGTRAIQIAYGSWDMHQDIYGTTNANGNNMFTMCPALDNGLSALIADLKSSGLLKETLIVVTGEFGRTPLITDGEGRDHHLNQTAVFAGGGVKGGKIIGSTKFESNTSNNVTVDYGWNGSGTTGPRYVWPEDVEATIYSALGIDWTTIRKDDPFGRGFEYVPFAYQGTYGPINELFV